MAQNYLEKFNSLLKKRQSQQVLKLLNKQKEAGRIRTIEEFTSRLDSLIKDLNQSNLSPTLKLFPAKSNETIDSESFNFLLDRVQDDLESAFEECNNIEEVQKSHEAILRDVVLKNLRAGLAELESKINLYEFIAANPNGFTKSIFSTFREASVDRSSRAIDKSLSIFYDPRRKELIPQDEDAKVDLIGERLTSATNFAEQISISSIREIFDSETSESELNTTPAGTRINKIIDNTKGTYWIKSFLFKEKREYAKLKVELTFPNVKDVNYIEIEPILDKTIVLEKIDYLTASNTVETIAEPNLTMTGPISYRFPKTTAQKMILTFRTDHAIPIQFEFPSIPVLKLFDQSFSKRRMPRLRSSYRAFNQVVSSPKIRDIVTDKVQKKKSSFSGYSYVIGLDNIRVGIFKYRNRSIYVSNPLKGKDFVQLALKTKETRPRSSTISGAIDNSSSTFNDTNDSYFYHSSIEYWVLRRSLDENGDILSDESFPILPLGVERINHERLLLTEKSDSSRSSNDQGYLVFFTNRTNGNVVVYRNGVAIGSSDDNPSLTTGWNDITSTADKTPNSGQRMAFKIKIKNPSPGDIYTVSYNPLMSTVTSRPASLSVYSSSGASMVDLIGTMGAWPLVSQLVRLDKSRKLGTIANTELRLAIILRNNTASQSISSVVEEYNLFAGQKDSRRIVEFL